MPFEKGGPKPKGSGREKGTLNRRTIERQRAIISSGKEPLQYMLDNLQSVAREVDEATAKLAKLKNDEPAALELAGRIAKLRDTVQRYAKDCAPFRHPQLQAIAYKHLSADGAPICPVVNLVVMQPPEPRPQLTSAGPKRDDTVQ